jgi:hypothetical protein
MGEKKGISVLLARFGALSDRPSRNCSTQTVAPGRATDRRPSRGYQSASPHRATARPTGPAPISPSYRPGCSPARSAR